MMFTILKKPLPRPDDKPSKKRGGKRVRGIKKKFELYFLTLLSLFRDK